MSIDKQRDHFNSIADKYFDARQDDKHLLLKSEIWNFLFSKINFNDSSDFNVLEAMCGYGEAIDIFSQYVSKNANFDAFDYSPAMVEYAKQRHPGAHIWNQDILTLDIQNKYDVIFTIGGLHHVYKHTPEIMSKISSALKPGGLFINYEPTNNNFIFQAARQLIYFKNSFFDYDTEKAFSTSELNTFAKEAGLDLSYQTYPGLLAYVLWYNPDAFPLLNIGKKSHVDFLVNIEKKIWSTKLARYFSFATLSCYKKST